MPADDTIYIIREQDTRRQRILQLSHDSVTSGQAIAFVLGIVDDQAINLISNVTAFSRKPQAR